MFNYNIIDKEKYFKYLNKHLKSKTLNFIFYFENKKKEKIKEICGISTNFFTIKTENAEISCWLNNNFTILEHIFVDIYDDFDDKFISVINNFLEKEYNLKRIFL